MADTERRATLIIQTKNEASKQTDDITKGFGKMFESITGLNLASVTAAGAIGAVGLALKDSVDKTVIWADEMDKMARITGMSTEEASKLSVVMGDFGISTDRLTVMIKKLTKEGIELNVDTLKQLATEYQSLPSAVEKNEFAVRNFGRAGLEMTEILSKTPAQIDALTAAAERSGKVMNEQSVEAAQAYKLQLAQLNDQVDGLKISLGSKLIPVLSEVITAEQNVWKVYDALWIKVQQTTGVIDDQTASVKAAELAGLSHAAALEQVYAAEIATADASDRATASMRAQIETGGKTIEMTQDQSKAWVELYDTMGDTIKANEAKAAVDRVTASMRDLSIEISGPVGTEFENFKTKQDELQTKAVELGGKIEELNSKQWLTASQKQELADTRAELDDTNMAIAGNADAHDEATKRIMFDLLTQRASIGGLSEDEMTFLNDTALKWGLVDQKTHDAVVSIDGALGDLAAGKINDARAAVDGLVGDIGRIPRAVDVNINIRTNNAAAGEVGIGPTGPTTVPVQPGEDIPVGGKYQHGADFIIPPGFNENFRIGSRGASSGERVTVTPAGQAGMGTAELAALIRALPGELRRAFREA